jgi:glycosyltransferase involved in cell wall biosynthesis
MEPRLSFIVPAYNSAGFLSDALDSALAQELDVPFEIIVADDASTDETPSLIADYERRHPGTIRSSRNERNLGGGGTRNRAVAQSRGELLYMLDSDNVIPAGMAQAVLDALRDSHLQAASIERLDYFTEEPGDGDHDWPLLHEDGVSTLRHMLESSAVPASHGNYAFTRKLYDAVHGYEEDRGAMDAWTFGLKHLLEGYDVAIAPDTFYFHRVGRDDSQWMVDAKRGVNDSNGIAVLHEHLDELPPDLRAKVALLTPADKLSTNVDAGMFRQDVSLEEFEARLQRSRRPRRMGRLRDTVGGSIDAVRRRLARAD